MNLKHLIQVFIKNYKIKRKKKLKYFNKKNNNFKSFSNKLMINNFVSFSKKLMFNKINFNKKLMIKNFYFFSKKQNNKYYNNFNKKLIIRY